MFVSIVCILTLLAEAPNKGNIQIIIIRDVCPLIDLLLMYLSVKD